VWRVKKGTLYEFQSHNRSAPFLFRFLHRKEGISFSCTFISTGMGSWSSSVIWFVSIQKTAFSLFSNGMNRTWSNRPSSTCRWPVKKSPPQMDGSLFFSVCKSVDIRIRWSGIVGYKLLLGGWRFLTLSRCWYHHLSILLIFGIPISMQSTYRT